MYKIEKGANAPNSNTTNNNYNSYIWFPFDTRVRARETLAFLVFMYFMMFKKLFMKI